MIKNQIMRTVALATLLFLFAVPALAGISAGKIKAAYINQFTHYINWPDSLASEAARFSICILGKGTVGESLKPLEKIPGAKISVSQLSKLNQADSCHMLYITEPASGSMKQTLKYLSGKPVVTISSDEHFVANGGMIGFVVINNKVRLEINLDACRRSNINISAKLIEVARAITDSSAKGGHQ